MSTRNALEAWRHAAAIGALALLAACDGSEADPPQQPIGDAGSGAATTGSGGGSAGAGGTTDDCAAAGGSPDFSSVTTRMSAAVEAGELDGVGLIVVDRCQVLYQYAAGTSGLETSLKIASATKLSSATVMMTLVDDGSIGLDDRIDKHLPYFVDDKGAITVRQLLSQTHGLPAEHPCIPAPGFENGLTLAECVEQIAADVVPLVPPGTVCEYNPAVSYQIMGRIAEVATGSSWETLWQTRVAEPLAMTHATYGAMQNPRIGGGLSTPLEDYAHLVQMHLRGGDWSGQRVLSEAAVLEMQKDHCVGLPFLNDTFKPEHGYGLSWWFDEVDTEGTPTQMSVAGKWGAIPWINHRHDYAAFWLTGDDLVRSVPVWQAVVPLVHESLEASEP